MAAQNAMRTVDVSSKAELGQAAGGNEEAVASKEGEEMPGLQGGEKQAKPSKLAKASKKALASAQSGGKACVGCASSWGAGYREFVLRGNIVDLAVAVVVGASFTALVNAVVADFLTPAIGAIFSGGFFDELYFTANGSKFSYGHFVNVLMTFIFTCTFCFFAVVVPTAALYRMYYGEKKKTRDCPECCSAIPEEACRCKFCCAAVEPKKKPPPKPEDPEHPDELVTGPAKV